jgi:hypothetical protein
MIIVGWPKRCPNSTDLEKIALESCDQPLGIWFGADSLFDVSSALSHSNHSFIKSSGHTLSC